MAFWNERMQAELRTQLEKTEIVSQAKNIIFFLGDGTSISTLTAARYLKGLRTGNFEHEVMAYEKFPYSTLIKTYSEKWTLVALWHCYGPESLMPRPWYYAHTAEVCGWHHQVIMGGGRQKLTPKHVDDPEGGDGGKRDDDKNLIETWINQKNLLGNASYVWHRNDLLAVDTTNTEYLMGLFDWGHMGFKVDNDVSNPSLREMTKTAIEILQKDTNGYFLFVEGGNIDLAHHLNEYRSALEEAVEFEAAIEQAVSMTDPQETLILVTADHSQPIVMNGYQERGSDVLDLGDYSDVDGLPFTTLMYTNGPGYRGEVSGLRPDPSKEDYRDPHYPGAATVPMIESNHAGEEVILYALGPHAHLFTGIHENAFIPHALRYAACVGEGLHYCSSLEV
nr:alkaline phosphatase, tissue-nonspecific isozyme-like [Cherax quadricarinatus]